MAPHPLPSVAYEVGEDAGLNDLTKRQKQILGFLVKYSKRHGRPPTRADIAEHFGFKSHNAAEDHLRALARKGAIKMTPGIARGIAVR